MKTGIIASEMMYTQTSGFVGSKSLGSVSPPSCRNSAEKSSILSSATTGGLQRAIKGYLRLLEAGARFADGCAGTAVSFSFLATWHSHAHFIMRMSKEQSWPGPHDSPTGHSP